MFLYFDQVSTLVVLVYVDDIIVTGIKRILRYLKGTMTDGLLIQPSSKLMIEAFTDADWGTQPDDRRSSSGYLVYLGNNLVSWSASK
ncbi:hypothetical protein UlMin_020778 [Ulmus minor]